MIEARGLTPLPSPEITASDNVANHLALDVYEKAGAKSVEMALEVSGDVLPSTRLMTTRYVLRREMGRCLKTEAGRKWPDGLTLQSGNIRLGLEFDCRHCRMNVVKI